MKRATIIHGWKASPDMNWFRWLGDQLSGLGYAVEIPHMPNPNDPTPVEWIEALSMCIGTPDRQTLLVGHSLGAHAILRYLESMSAGHVGTAVLVAPWPNLNRVKDSSYSKVARRWMGREPDWKAIRANVDRVVAVFSATDPFVLPGNSHEFSESLGAKVVMLADNGHIVDETVEVVFDEIRLADRD